MNFLKYLKKIFYLENYEPIELQDDIFFLNDVTLKDIKSINKILDYKILDFSVISRDYQDLESKIRKINPIVLTKRGIVDLNQMKKNYVDEEAKGIVILKKLDSQKQIIKKQYDKLSDLKKNQNNLCLYHNTIDEFITVYDKNLILKNGELNYEGLLFVTTFEKKDSSNLYGATMIIGMASNLNFNGEQLAYPITAALTHQEGLLYAYRDGITPSNLSPGARTVWYNFFTKKNIFKPHIPIDDRDAPVTDLKIDDGEVYNILTKDQMNQWQSEKVNFKDFKDQQNQLKKMKSGDFFDWVFQLKSSIKSQVISISKILENNHAHFKKDHPNIENMLIDKADDFFRKMKKIRESKVS